MLSDKSIRDLCLLNNHNEYAVTTEDLINVTEQTQNGLRATMRFKPIIVGNGKPMIEPFIGESINQDASGRRITSYGLSSYGYDVRLADRFKIFKKVDDVPIDPLDMKDHYYEDHQGESVILPPNSYLLGHTVETFSIPDNVTAIAVGKSTWARAGVIVNVTPIEAGFEGQVEVSVINATQSDIRIYANMGIAKMIFHMVK